MKKVDWGKLAKEIDSIDKGGTVYACLALEKIIGQDVLRNAVDDYVNFRNGFELARSVLRHIHPWSAMERCYKIYKTDEMIERKRSAVELLRVIADKRAIKWIREFLNDEDEIIQNWGVGILDQLLFGSLVEEEEVEDLIKNSEAHKNPHVQEKAKWIRGFLKERQK